MAGRTGRASRARLALQPLRARSTGRTVQAVAAIPATLTGRPTVARRAGDGSSGLQRLYARLQGRDLLAQLLLLSRFRGHGWRKAEDEQGGSDDGKAAHEVPRSGCSG